MSPWTNLSRVIRPGALILLAVLLTGAAAAQAAKEKYFDRSGTLVVVETPAAELLRAYEVKNLPRGETFPVPPPPFSEGIFPCSDCHAGMTPNLARRQLTDEHTDIVLNHAEGQRWCLDCHNPEDRDTLRLVSGEVIGFNESYRLCGQCHGDKYRDWRQGLHGKRTGYWNGDKQYLLCAHCHNPHDPRFKPLTPLPPPLRPEEIKL
ncbi:cytochrome c3 family protein [Geoalkalibacter sp.]|uniref:cytochrome c3 family protein n=1 Tax=Geoalkalibacter sp. TaxID=3041440 RepID=UPI00272EE143|nr:cytochrome c3 family protein [Geoalkalibacter sp.]